MKRYLCAVMLSLGTLTFVGYNAVAGVQQRATFYEEKHGEGYYDGRKHTDDYDNNKEEYHDDEDGNDEDHYGDYSGSDKYGDHEGCLDHDNDEGSPDPDKYEDQDGGHRGCTEEYSGGNDDKYYSDDSASVDDMDDKKDEIEKGQSREFQLSAKAVVSSDHITVLVSVGYNGNPLDFLPDDHFATDTDAQISCPGGANVKITDFENVGRGYYRLTFEASESLDGIECLVFPIEVDCPDSGLSGRIILDVRT